MSGEDAAAFLHFDFVDASGRRAVRTFSNPARVIVASSLSEVAPAMEALERARGEGHVVAGFVAYEAASAFDPALVTRPPAADSVPLVWFGVFPAAEPTAIESWPAEEDRSPAERAEPVPTPGIWRADLEPGEYARGVEAVRAAIARGDSYQANYTFRLRAGIDSSRLEALYHQLVADQRPPYAAWLDLGAWRILSLSPELFFRIHDGRLVTRPMKGTAPRGLWLEQDDERARALATSEKNRAENVMIVDLARNDIGRIAEVGSVHATSLFEVERYPTVFQMVSTVEGHPRPATNLSDVFRALFPAGSVTGAPKTSSMRLIAGIERAPRGVYCGAIGYAMPNGDAVFNVAIRTLVAHTPTGRAEYGIGGGITWDSTATGEYEEALSKAFCLTPTPSFDLLETFRFEAGSFVRLDRHLRRMRDSAEYFAFEWDEGRVTAALDAFANRHRGETLRVRLRVSRSGQVKVERGPLHSPATGNERIVLADEPVASTDRFLYHKTTHRAVYERHRAMHPQAFDVLLWNERREVTELTIGNVVVERDGTLWTPARECGLLAGTFREELLDRGDIHEAIVRLDELSSCSRLWLINSVREWVEVAFDPATVDHPPTVIA